MFYALTVKDRSKQLKARASGSDACNYKRWASLCQVPAIMKNRPLVTQALLLLEGFDLETDTGLSYVAATQNKSHRAYVLNGT